MIGNTRAGGFNDEGTFADDNLHAGDFPIRGRKVTLVAGTYKRGHLLGQITTGGKYNVSLAAASDGSQTPRAICAEDLVLAADGEAIVYIAGDFNQNAMTFGTGHTADSVREGLRDLNIYLHKPVVA